MRFVGVVTLCLCLGAPWGVAAEKRAEKLARLVLEADRLYKNGRYHESAERLKEAYALEPNPRLLYNIARAYDQAGELTEALDYYQQYVGVPEGNDAPLLKRSSLAIDRIKGLLNKQADQARSEAQAKAQAERAQAEAAEARRAQEAAEVRSRAAAEAVLEVAQATRRRQRTASLIVGGVGVAAVGVGVAFGVEANAAYSHFKSATTVSDKDINEAQTRTASLIADVSFAAGVAALATAALLFPKGPEPTLALGVGPRGAFLVGRFP